jgi:glycosyltransferase involved in cell wall biosynthesis
MFPTENKPQWGNFVREQVDALRTAFPDEFDVEVHLVDASRSNTAYLKSMLQLPAKIKSGNYDIVHAHFGLTLLALLWVRARIVVTFHGSDILRQPVGSLSKMLATKADQVIVVSENIRSSLGYGTIIPCGIDTLKFALPVDYSRLRDSRVVKVLFPSNPEVAVKNYPLFQKACRSIEAQGYTVQEIQLKGVPRERVPELFWDADLMLLTSLSEGSPTVVKEAIAAKLPFVSVDVGDVRRWTAKIDFGAVIATWDPADLASTGMEMVRDVEDRKQLDNQEVLKLFDNRLIVEKVAALYRHLLASKVN